MRGDRGTVYSLQYLRAIAATLVVFHHVREQFPGLRTAFASPFGSAGVDLFFVISGFIMVFVTSGRGQTGWEFLFRRIVRVVPLYWIFTSVFAAMIIVMPSIFRTAEFSISHYLASILFIPTENFEERIRPLISIGWTLNYEMMFYVVFASTLFLRSSLQILAVSALFFLICLVRYLGFEEYVPLTFYGDTIVFEFVAGMLIARLFLSPYRIPAFICALLGFVGIATFFLVAMNVPEDRFWRFVFFGGPAVLIVLGFTGLEKTAPFLWRGQDFIRRLVLLIGDASYALYLSHIFTLGLCRAVFMFFGGEPTSPVEIWSFAACCVVASIIVAVAVHLMLERPLTRFGNSLVTRRSRVEAA